MISKPVPGAADLAAVQRVIEKADGPVTKSTIGCLTGLCDRVIREAVSVLVKQGVPIVTDRVSGGYEWTLNGKEIRAEVGRLRSHARHIDERADALEKHLPPEQKSLFA